MRVVVLSSSVYSETACAVALRMAELGYVPNGVLALRTLTSSTVLRKLGQWGTREVARYARAKLIPPFGNFQSSLRNPHLQPLLQHGGGSFRSLREVAAVYNFPVSICSDQNAADSVARLQEWTPDLIIFTGGKILRSHLLDVPRLGVLNAHLGLLPEVRGMNAPEWSLLNRIPVGVTIHYMDAGIDTGPILQRSEFPDASQCQSLSDLRHRLIAFGVEKIAEVVTALDRGTISATPQPDLPTNRHTNNDNQFFVMHDWLQARAAERLSKRSAIASHPAAIARTVDVSQ